MNGVDARSRETYGGYHGEFRTVRTAGYRKVQKGGTPVVFPTAEAAEVAGWRAMRSHIFSLIVGTGEKTPSAKTHAEEMFGVLIKRGRKIPVERRT